MNADGDAISRDSSRSDMSCCSPKMLKGDWISGKEHATRYISPELASLDIFSELPLFLVMFRAQPSPHHFLVQSQYSNLSQQ